jgi:DNA-binding response OmpR family regulator
MEAQRRVLIVDDDPNLVDLLRVALQRNGYYVLSAYNGIEGEKQFRSNPVDVVILDVMMPHRDGFTLCRELRSFSNVPIIMLTARQEVEDVVHGLEIGADDYITKPFNLREVVARVNAVLSRVDRHRGEGASRVKTIGEVSLDLDRGIAQVRGKEIQLTPIELELMYYLMMHAGRMLDREALLRDVWGYDYFGKTNLVDVAIRRLREKIEVDPSEPTYLLTVRGQGYRFVAPNELA